MVTFFKNIFRISRGCNSETWTCWKKGRRKMMKSHLINSWKSWIWDQYLPENMKYIFNDIESNIGHLESTNFVEGLVSTNPDDRCLEMLERRGDHNNEHIFWIGPEPSSISTVLNNNGKYYCEIVINLWNPKIFLIVLKHK